MYELFINPGFQVIFAPGGYDYVTYEEEEEEYDRAFTKAVRSRRSIKNSASRQINLGNSSATRRIFT